MNIYFLLEGLTEKKVYFRWLAHLAPRFKKVAAFDDAVDFNYYLFNCGGYPSILDDIDAAVRDINACGKYSHFVVCLDADEEGVRKRSEEVRAKIESSTQHLTAQDVIIVQNVCIETWFLGNRKVYARNPQGETFQNYCKLFNVSTDDPELMSCHSNFNSVSQFHEDYLKKMLAEKDVRYTKKQPSAVCEPHYIDELRKRTEDHPKHLQSLQIFFVFCNDINATDATA